MPRPGLRATLAATLLLAGVAGASPFDPPVSHPVPSGLAAVAIGDVDGDGLADVLAIHGALSLLLNDGAGPASPQTVDHGPGGAHAAAVEDVDGDGDRDIVVLIREGDALLVVLRNQGDGSFAAPEPYGTPDITHQLRIADVDRDGDPDAVVISGFTGGATVSVLRNDGTGAFAVPEQYGIAPTTFFYTADLAVGDVDRDGFPDVVACVIGDFFLLLNDGTGGLLPAGTIELGQHGPKAVLLRDVDRDGRPDLLAADTCGPEGDRLLVGRNDGDGGFTLVESEPISGVCHSVTIPTGLAVGYLDDDTTLDVAYPSRTGGAVGVVRGLGDGTFEAAEMLPADPSTLVVAVGDVDGEGSHDVVSGNGVTIEPDAVVVTTNAQCAPLFDQPLRADDAGSFSWPTSLPYLAVRGGFASAQQIGSFVVDRQYTADANELADAEAPLAGAGFWYLVRPDCVGASWTSAGPAEMSGRDAVLP